MAPLVHLTADLITAAVLLEQHHGEPEICVPPGAIITPSARDYLRLHRVTVRRGDDRAAPLPAPAPTPSGTPIQEVLPPGAEAGLLYQGRCDHPDRSFGCRTEEFGSGFVEPACCAACALKNRAGGRGCDCDGCNRQADSGAEDAGFEALVQRLTDEIMARVADGPTPGAAQPTRPQNR